MVTPPVPVPGCRRFEREQREVARAAAEVADEDRGRPGQSLLVGIRGGNRLVLEDRVDDPGQLERFAQACEREVVVLPAARDGEVHRTPDDRPRRQGTEAFFAGPDQPLHDQGDQLRERALPSADGGAGKAGIAQVRLQ